MKTNATSISYRGRVLPLFYHAYNCGLSGETRTTERSVEIAVADFWLSQCSNDVIELGAVTPYYFPGRVPAVVDPFDGHPLVTDRKSLFDCNFSGRDVLCLSTLEHIGTEDYGCVSIHEDSVAAFKRVLVQSRRCLISIPLGYNTHLDEFLFSTPLSKSVTVTYYYRGALHNDWKMSTHARQVRHFPYGPFSANAIAIIEKQ